MNREDFTSTPLFFYLQGEQRSSTDAILRAHERDRKSLGRTLCVVLTSNGRANRGRRSVTPRARGRDAQCESFESSLGGICAVGAFATLSDTVIARPTTEAPGSADFASTLSRWCSVNGVFVATSECRAHEAQRHAPAIHNHVHRRMIYLRVRATRRYRPIGAWSAVAGVGL
jgi:hypothetical protein